MTENPSIPIARAFSKKSLTSGVRNFRYTKSRFNASNARLWTTGESEWPTGLPTMPISFVVRLTRRNRYTSRISRTVNCPGADMSADAAYVKKLPRAGPAIRVIWPISPIPITTTGLGHGREVKARRRRLSDHEFAMLATFAICEALAHARLRMDSISEGVASKSWNDPITAAPAMGFANR